jgi:hypothetical protein
MKDNETNEHAANSEGNTALTPADAQRTKKNDKSKTRSKESKHDKKKSFRRSWRSASPITKWTLVFVGVAAGSTLVYVGVTFWQTLEVRWAAHEQHMPLVINSRPAQFLQPFVCDVQKGFHTGNMQTAVKNIGNASAQHVVPFLNSWKIIPEKKTGNPVFDALPEANCRMRLNAKELESPLAPGQEVFPQIRQMAGPVPPITKTDPVQLYWVSCVYYSDEYGGNHGTCDTYRLLLPSTNPLDLLSGSPTFFCDAAAKIGKFQDTVGGHCQE